MDWYCQEVAIEVLPHIGLREKEVNEQGYEYKVAKFPVTSIPRVRIDGNTYGFLNMIVDTNKFAKEQHSD